MIGCAMQERFLRVCDPPPVPCPLCSTSVIECFSQTTEGAEDRGGRGQRTEGGGVDIHNPPWNLIAGAVSFPPPPASPG